MERCAGTSGIRSGKSLSHQPLSHLSHRKDSVPKPGNGPRIRTAKHPQEVSVWTSNPRGAKWVPVPFPSRQPLPAFPCLPCLALLPPSVSVPSACLVDGWIPQAKHQPMIPSHVNGRKWSVCKSKEGLDPLSRCPLDAADWILSLSTFLSPLSSRPGLPFFIQFAFSQFSGGISTFERCQRSPNGSRATRLWPARLGGASSPVPHHQAARERERDRAHTGVSP